VMHDIVLGVPPLDEEDVLRMMGALRTAPLLRGYRGAPVADERAVARIALALLACAAAHPELDEIELNPVFVHADAAMAVDVRAFRRATAGDDAHVVTGAAHSTRDASTARPVGA
jgi:acetate---CoA ligase (ADP-forming)